MNTNPPEISALEVTKFLGITSNVLSNAAFLVAGVLFILALRGLSSQQTARRGNLYGIIGMLI
ncbi:MAG: NAD(P)(+) transhydrogenase (Re/Si-specific) subunit beta, partial [Kofleriaceae bacterium]